MYRKIQGSTNGFSDTERFIDLLDHLPESVSPDGKSFFSSASDLIVTRAPGRLDLMGGIADYSGSLVLQLPIASAAHVALQISDDTSISIVSLAADGKAEPRRFEMLLEDLKSSGGPISYADARARFAENRADAWAAYVAGAFLTLMREYGQKFERGARILIKSEVPEGKGVSSSAALEVAAMQAIAAAFEVDISPRDTALLCQRVENHVAGAPCGVMDQMTAACGEQDRLLALLCQPGELRGTVELPPELAVYGIDSGIRHSVGGADYGTVRTAAFMGYRIIADIAGLSAQKSNSTGRVDIEDNKWGGYLANIDPSEFEEHYARHLPPTISGAEFLDRFQGITDRVTSVDPKRHYPIFVSTQHPIYESARVKEFARILETWGGVSDAERIGELMYASHQSYSDCGLGTSGTDEIVRLVKEAGPAKGLYGAKITGGGSGGTVAVLCHRNSAEAVAQIAAEYSERTGRASIIIAGSSPGAARFGHVVLRSET